MTDLAAHGIEVTLPSGWEGRVFRRPSAGEVGALDADGPPAPSGETTHAVVHVSTIALPPGVTARWNGEPFTGHTDDLVRGINELELTGAPGTKLAPLPITATP